MARKTTAKAEEKKIVEPEVIEVETKLETEAEVETRPEKKAKVEKKTFAANDGIKCSSIRQGNLFFTGAKSGMTYVWSCFGDIVDIEYRDLVAAIQSRSSYVYDPFFIIDDEDFIAEFSELKKFYDEKYAMKDLRGVLNLSVADMKREIAVLPEGAKQSLRSIASTVIQNGEIDSYSRVKAIDEALGTQFLLLYMQ